MSDLNKPLGKNVRPGPNKPGTPLTPSIQTFFYSFFFLLIFVPAGVVSYDSLSSYAQSFSTDLNKLKQGKNVAVAVDENSATKKKQLEINKGQPEKKRPKKRKPKTLSVLPAQNQNIAHIPNPELIEKSKHGLLPIKISDSFRPVDVYRREWSGARGTRIAIVVGGLGLSQTGTQKALRSLPETITLAFASNGNSLSRWTQKARQNGHEILLQVPFEPFNYPANDPGPRTVTTQMDKLEKIKEFKKSLGRMTNYTGIMNFMGAKLMAEEEHLSPIMEELYERGVLFLDNGTSAQSKSEQLAEKIGTVFAAADLKIDQSLKRSDILAKLDELERIARRNGTAIGTASAFESSISAISFWVNEVSKRGIEIVPVSSLAYDPINQ